MDRLTSWPVDFRHPPASAVLGLEMYTAVPDIFVGAGGPHLTIFLILYFMCMGVLLVCMSVQHRHAVTTETRRGCWISLVLELQTVIRQNVVLGMEPGSSGSAVSALNH